MRRFGCALMWLAAASPGQAATPCAEPDAAGFPRIALREVARGLDEPVHIAVAPGVPNRLYVVEQGGTIRVVESGRVRNEVFLDLSDRVESGGEKGLLAVVFHPRFRENREFFVNYTARDRRGLHTRVSRFRAQSPERAEAGTETVLLRIDQPYSNHNGGQLAFGPDGYLYVGTGDGGSANDPRRNAQNPDSLLGKLLRIDVDRSAAGQGYAVPTDNPFIGKKGFRPEIWALGLRNPWRFSFDAGSGVLWLADVGQDQVEEIDIVRKGGNYGWHVMEGNICNPAIDKRCDATGFDPPVFVYRHPDGFSVTGGFVYRGGAIPRLCGAYLYADYVTKRLWALRLRDGRVVAQTELLSKAPAISSFGEDHELELYVTDHRFGRILKIVASP
jgi:glucose/arabinose dehydrogenase